MIHFSVLLPIWAFLFLSSEHNNTHNNNTAATTTMATAQDKVTREWDAMAGEWDDMAAGYRDEFVKLLWKETEYDDPDKRKNLVVLDFGCATGLLTEAVRTQVKQVIGMDVAPSMIQVLKDKIKAGEWDNVEAYCAVEPETVSQIFQGQAENPGKDHRADQ